ncbi:MAG: hypothetical protein A3K67_01650 [Euryarchaeota archaeon RBG_16_62_10]|nr:MAG: hypothetical protein A3K67_01650 [Euryarchaeota archaeon RBG_16_62_10]
MQIAVFGAGSLGSALGGLLAYEHEVVLVGRKEHMGAVRRSGLRIVDDIRRIVKLEAVMSLRGRGDVDLLIVTTKAYDTKSAIDECKRWTGRHTRVLTLQNGLGNLELIRSWRGQLGFGGTTTMGATLLSPGVVRLSGFGRTVIGSDMDVREAGTIAKAFSSCGIPVSVTANIGGEIWAKAAVNACINPTTAVLRVRNGRLLESDSVMRLVRAVSVECEQVARAASVRLPCRPLFKKVVEVATETSENVSSMLRDIELGRRTEIEQINGGFCRVGDEQGVPTPMNKALTSMVRALEASTAKEKG